MVPHASGERVAEQDLPAAPFAPLAPSPAAEPQGAVARDDMLRFLGPGTSGFDENGELCILKDRLYLASLSGFPSPRAKKYYITLSKKMRYMPFCADFGPFNLGTLHHICQALSKTLMNPELQDTRVVYYTSQDPRDVTNSICLLGAYLCLRLGASPQEAWQPFQALRETPNGPMCLPYRDATWVKSPYDLDVMDVWAGLLRAVGAGLYDMRNFDKHEYFYYDDPQNGDLHVVVPGKFLAFRGPRDAVDHRGSLQPSDYVEVFKTLNVSTIVRLNKAEYNKKTFTAAGFLHVDQVFEDCSVPPSNIVDSFLRRAEGLKPGQVMAVHCLAGLGRTGTLIAMYMMKHMGFTANEAMGWLRVCRPGSIIGPQQQFLADHEARMHRLGAAGVPGLGNQLVNSTFAQTSSPSNYKSQDGMAQSKVLAEMVTDGMLNRRKKAVQVDSQQEAATRSFLPWLGQQNQQAASQREKAPLPKASQKQSPSGGGMKRSISNPSLLQMAPESKKTQSTRAPIQSASLRNVNANKSSGFGGVNSLRKTGSFNNMSNVPHMQRLLSGGSAASSAVSEDPGGSGSDEDSSDADLDAYAQVVRAHSADGLDGLATPSPPGSGSLCFGGMEKLHRNAPAHLLESAAEEKGTKTLGKQGEGGTKRQDWSPISLFRRARRTPETN